jgi:hypothetical protein
MRSLALVLALLAACNSEPETPDTGLAGYDPDRVAREQAACTERGGRWGRGGKTGGFLCFTPTRDANRSCDSASDCEGLCFARSRTCAPFTPVFGCNEVLTSLGSRSTLCID